MIIEVEVAREPGPCKVRLVPAPVGPLRGAAPAPVGLAVGAQVLAEAAVVVLHPLEPRDRAPHAPVAGKPASSECGNDGADAVDVVRAPAPEPGAVRLLLGKQVVDPRAR